MTPADRRLLALVARKVVGLGLGCRTPACPLWNMGPRPGEPCDRMDECLAEREELVKFCREMGLEVPHVR